MTVLDRVCETCERRVLEAGETYVIESALDRNGHGLAGDFLDRLAVGRSSARDLLADALIRLETFARSGQLEVPRELNHLHGDLHEVKVGTLRLPFYYRPGASCGQVRLTHGFVKRGQRTPRKEIDLGLAIIREDRKHDGV